MCGRTVWFRGLTLELLCLDSTTAMFDTQLWPRNPLALREIVEIADLFLKFAQNISNQNVLLLLSANVTTVLSAVEHGARKTLSSSLSAEDQDLRENVASVFTEHGKLWERLQNAAKARSSFKKAEKWR